MYLQIHFYEIFFFFVGLEDVLYLQLRKVVDLFSHVILRQMSTTWILVLISVPEMIYCHVLCCPLND